MTRLCLTSRSMGSGMAGRFWSRRCMIGLGWEKHR